MWAISDGTWRLSEEDEKVAHREKHGVRLTGRFKHTIRFEAQTGRAEADERRQRKLLHQSTLYVLKYLHRRGNTHSTQAGSTHWSVAIFTNRLCLKDFVHLGYCLFTIRLWKHFRSWDHESVTWGFEKKKFVPSFHWVSVVFGGVF